jgi:hypothetical protein
MHSKGLLEGFLDKSTKPNETAVKTHQAAQRLLNEEMAAPAKSNVRQQCNPRHHLVALPDVQLRNVTIWVPRLPSGRVPVDPYPAAAHRSHVQTSSSTKSQNQDQSCDEPGRCKKIMSLAVAHIHRSCAKLLPHAALADCTSARKELYKFKVLTKTPLTGNVNR